MNISRRQFICKAAAAGVIASSIGYLSFANSKAAWLVSACTDNKGQHYVAACDLNGTLISKIKLPARGHDAIALAHKPGRAIIFARRPGKYALEVDFIRGEVIAEINAAEHSHFYGHGVYHRQSHTLLTSENYYKTGEGQIVIRDADNYQELARYSSGGVGPHQIALMPDGETLVMANGGIETHPDFPRKKLNLDSMQPNLAYMDLTTGQIDDKFELENKRLSIRHLDVSSQGKVVAGLQYQGVSTDEVPLAISHHGENELSLLKADTDTWRKMKQYTASVCINSKSNTVVITCPKADLLTFWQLDSNTFISSHKLKDGAGATLLDDSFIASTGRGRIISQHDPLKPYQVRGNFNDLRWDNHMTAILA